MGIRISLFAVDVPAFAEFIKRPLGDLFWYFSDHASGNSDDLGDALYLWEWPPSKGRYFARPGRDVIVVRGEKPRTTGPISRSMSEWPAFLKLPTNEFLSNEDSGHLLRLLRALTQCPAASFVRSITDGYKRWWVGSMLENAERGL